VKRLSLGEGTQSKVRLARESTGGSLMTQALTGEPLELRSKTSMSKQAARQRHPTKSLGDEVKGEGGEVLTAFENMPIDRSWGETKPLAGGAQLKRSWQ